MLFLSGWDSGLVFSRRARSRLVWPLSIPVDSPRDKRGIVWSGNRGLGIGIRVENGRFPPMGGPRRKTGYAGSNERGWRGKTDPPRGRDLVNRKNCFSKKKSYGRKSMLILDQGEIGKG